MKRTQKLHEAFAIIAQSQRKLSALNDLKFDVKTRKFLSPDIQEAYDALDTVQHLLSKLIEQETGLNEKTKWDNAAHNLGGES